MSFTVANSTCSKRASIKRGAVLNRHDAKESREKGGRGLFSVYFFRDLVMGDGDEDAFF